MHTKWTIVKLWSKTILVMHSMIKGIINTRHLKIKWKYQATMNAIFTAKNNNDNCPVLLGKGNKAETKLDTLTVHLS